MLNLSLVVAVVINSNVQKEINPKVDPNPIRHAIQSSAAAAKTWQNLSTISLAICHLTSTNYRSVACLGDATLGDANHDCMSFSNFSTSSEIAEVPDVGLSC